MRHWDRDRCCKPTHLEPEGLLRTKLARGMGRDPAPFFLQFNVSTLDRVRDSGGWWANAEPQVCRTDGPARLGLPIAVNIKLAFGKQPQLIDGQLFYPVKFSRRTTLRMLKRRWTRFSGAVGLARASRKLE